MTSEDVDFIISELQKLLIQQSFNDKQKGIAYIKKIDVYSDLINFFKKIKKEEGR